MKSFMPLKWKNLITFLSKSSEIFDLVFKSGKMTMNCMSGVYAKIKIAGAEISYKADHKMEYFSQNYKNDYKV